MESLTETGRRRLVSRGVRGRILAGFRPAVVEVFGEAALEGLERVLPDHIAKTTLSTPPEWVPELHMIGFCGAVDDQLARNDPHMLRKWVARSIDHGFGVARRVLLAIATPSAIVRRSSELWRDEFSSGRLVAFHKQPNEALLTLHDSVFSETERMRAVTAEALRRTIELAGAQDAAAAYDPEPGRTLAVTVSWR